MMEKHWYERSEEYQYREWETGAIHYHGVGVKLSLHLALYEICVQYVEVFNCDVLLMHMFRVHLEYSRLFIFVSSHFNCKTHNLFHSRCLAFPF